MINVRTETFNVMRELGLTTVFGNPGSTEQDFIQDFPADMTYVLALQEASVAVPSEHCLTQLRCHPGCLFDNRFHCFHDRISINSCCMKQFFWRSRSRHLAHS